MRLDTGGSEVKETRVGVGRVAPPRPGILALPDRVGAHLDTKPLESCRLSVEPAGLNGRLTGLAPSPISRPLGESVSRAKSAMAGEDLRPAHRTAVVGQLDPAHSSPLPHSPTTFFLKGRGCREVD